MKNVSWSADRKAWVHNPTSLKERLKSDTVLRKDGIKGRGSAAHRRRVREALLDVHGPHCWLCNKRIVNEDPTLDHIVPRSQGGRNAIANLRLAHRRCNERRGNGPVPELLLTDFMRLDRPQGWASHLLSPGSKPLVETTEIGSTAKPREPEKRNNTTA